MSCAIRVELCTVGWDVQEGAARIPGERPVTLPPSFNEEMSTASCKQSQQLWSNPRLLHLEHSTLSALFNLFLGVVEPSLRDLDHRSQSSVGLSMF